MSSEFECRICGERSEHPMIAAREMMYGTREVFKYFKCSSCGCLQIDSIPHTISDYYPDNYYSYRLESDVTTASKFKMLLQKERCRAALFGRGIKVSRVLGKYVDLPQEWFEVAHFLKIANLGNFDDAFLDVGCGERSQWLEKVRRVGFTRLIGVDPFIKGDKVDGKITYVKRHLCEIEGSFRFITFHHSLEHIPDQLAQLTAARRLLLPGGVCLVRIPVVSSFVWEKYGRDWVELDAPRHLYLHSDESIKLIAEKAGLRLVDTVCDSFEFEFAGSEQYKRDIPLNDNRSYIVNAGERIFTDAEMDFFKQEAHRVNREGTAGRKAFVFMAKE